MGAFKTDSRIVVHDGSSILKYKGLCSVSQVRYDCFDIYLVRNLMPNHALLTNTFVSISGICAITLPCSITAIWRRLSVETRLDTSVCDKKFMRE